MARIDHKMAGYVSGGVCESEELFSADEEEDHDDQDLPLQTSSGSDIESEPEDAARDESRVGASSALLQQLFSKPKKTHSAGVTPNGEEIVVELHMG